MTWKFPGSESGHGGDLMADMGLWEERECIAKRLYEEAMPKDPQIQAFEVRYPAWDALDEPARKPWLYKARQEMKA